MTFDYPWALLALIPATWLIWRSFLILEQSPKSPWGFLLDGASKQDLASTEKKKCSWLPFLLAWLALVIALILLSGPRYELRYHIWVSEPQAIQNMDESYYLDWLAKIKTHYDKSGAEQCLFYSAKGRVALDLGNIDRNDLLASLGRDTKQPSPLFLSQTGMRLVCANQDVYRNENFLATQAMPEFAISEIVYLDKDKYMVTIKRWDASPRDKLRLLNDQVHVANKESFLKDENRMLLELQSSPDLKLSLSRNKTSTKPVFLSEPKIENLNLKIIGKHDPDLINFLKQVKTREANANVLLSDSIPEGLKFSGHALVFTDKNHAKHDWLVQEKIDTSLFMQSSRNLAQASRHAMFDYTLKARPEYSLKNNQVQTLMHIDSLLVTAKLTHEGYEKFISTVPINSILFKNNQEKQGYYKLCLASLGLINLDGEILYQYEKPEALAALERRPLDKSNHHSSGFYLSCLVLSMILFLIALRKRQIKE